MPHVDNSAILQRLGAWSPEDQNLALRALKNDTVGQILKKEKWVGLGVLRPVVKIITTRRQHGWAASARQDTRPAVPAALPDSLSPEDVARLQALELLGIFASGGPAFLPPLHAAGAMPALLACLDPSTTQPRLVYAALRSVSTLAKATLLAPSLPNALPSITTVALADALFAAPSLGAFHRIFALDPRHVFWAESIANVACSLVSSLCRDERHQIALAKAGILDALTVKIASYVVAQGQVVPGADVAAEKEGLRDAIPEPASPAMDLAAVMNAVAAIMGDSRLRACMVLHAPSILAIFPQIEFEGSVNDLQAAWRALSMGGLSNIQQPPLGALDLLLPPIPSQQSRIYNTQSSPFPPLGMAFSRENLASFGRTARNKRPPATQELPGVGWGTGPTGRSVSSLWGQGATSTELLLLDEGDEVESPMIPWLISLVRSTAGLERLTAAAVLTSLYKADFANKTREAAMALLVVPLLLRMLDDAATTTSESAPNSSSATLPSNGAPFPSQRANDDHAVAEQRTITETALNVLARLVANSDVLQKAAVDCNAIKILARLLKESYEPVSPRLTARPWNPIPASARAPSRSGSSHPDSDMDNNDGEVEEASLAAASSRLGPAGQSTLLAYRIRLREATLKALTSLVAIKYEYQNALVGQDIMPYLVASLEANPSKPRSAKEKSKSPKDAAAPASAAPTGAANVTIVHNEDAVDPEYGRNPVGVLVAACNCVRMLSRSIAILRTTLEDAGVSSPIFRLLQHPEIDVQTAATGVVCNLVTETSPMRQRYADAGIMTILCNHAHSLNSPLRLNALWALKHLVDGVDPDMKKACLEQLGSGWLVQLIDPDSDDDTHLFARPYDSTINTLGGLGTGDAMGSDVEMDQMDEDKEEESDRSAGKMPWTLSPGKEPGTGTAGSSASASLQRANFPRMSHERSRTGRLRQAEAKLAALRDLEVTVLYKNRNDDIVIQEQGLNFIRNLIGPNAGGSSTGVPSSSMDPTAEVSEMIDYLFSEIGSERLFQILLSKLKLKVLHPFERRSTAGGPVGGGSSSSSAGASSPARILRPQVRIIEAVLFILVHISASAPRHRQMVISQTELLKALVPQFSNRYKGVRVALCHLLTNLTWRDDASDTQAATARTHELKRLGLLTKLQVLQQEDIELDVREQAKMAIHQMGGTTSNPNAVAIGAGGGGVIGIGGTSSSLQHSSNI